jgi:hypothetical protein
LLRKKLHLVTEGFTLKYGRNYTLLRKKLHPIRKKLHYYGRNYTDCDNYGRNYTGRRNYGRNYTNRY